MTESSAITRQAKSNLAFALHILPRERREDAVAFYAFCRVVDDLADDLDQSLESREAGLMAWRRGLEEGFADPNPLQREVLAMRERCAVPTELLVAIIDGCRMDLRPQRFRSWEELSGYTWKVACAVGLVAVRIFGSEDGSCEDYAVALGHALQLTNIIRDVSEDLANGSRIYLPLDDLERFGYREDELVRQVHDERFVRLMEFEAARADQFYREAGLLLPDEARKLMVPAEIMREIYGALLDKMRDDRFQVFGRRYRLSKARKMAIFSKHLVLKNSHTP